MTSGWRARARWPVFIPSTVPGEEAALYTVKITNTYSDGHESKHEVLVDPPELTTWRGDREELDLILVPWFEDTVWPHTGDGHGADNPDAHAHYLAEIIAADREELLGEWFEWC